MNQFDKIWIIWLFLVCIWNFGFPKASAFADVTVAMALSIRAYQIKKYKK